MPELSEIRRFIDLVDVKIRLFRRRETSGSFICDRVTGLVISNQILEPYASRNMSFSLDEKSH